MPVYVLRDTDVGAPVVTGESGGVYAAMDQAAVGSGMTIAYSEPEYRIYQTISTGGGLGCFIKIVHHTAHGGASSTDEFTVQCFATMSDAVTGTFDTGVVWIRVSATTTNIPRKYVIVADGRCFRVMYFHDTGDPVSTVLANYGMTKGYLGYAGETSHLDPTNPWRYCVIGCDRSNNTNGSVFTAPFLSGSGDTGKTATASNYPTVRVLSPVDGSTLVTNGVVIPSAMGIASSASGNAGTAIGNYSWTGRRVYQPLTIYARAGNNASGTLVGTLRGILLPCSNMTDLTAAELQGGVEGDYIRCFTFQSIGNSFDNVAGWMVSTAEID